MHALSHLKILDLSRVLAGPWATQMLGDMGAEVWKIERPKTGDETRGWGPPYVMPPSDNEPGVSAYFAGTNRNKKSLAIDITHKQGADLICQLAGKADVLIENFKVGGLKKYGLDYDSLKQKHPHLIYCSLTGFGQDGPDAARAGYDFMIQGMSGLMSVTGFGEGMPVKAGVALVDILTGLNASTAILAAIEHRRHTGRGQHIDLALFDVGVASMANQALNYLTTGMSPERMGNAHPNIVPYQAFETRDGHLILAVGNDRQFESFCEVAGVPDLAKDERFRANDGRVRNREQLIPLLDPVLASRTTDDWLAILAEKSVPAGPVNDMKRVFEEPQAIHRALHQTSPEADGVSHPMVANPLRFSDSEVDCRLPAPRLGAHTCNVLTSELGLHDTEINTLLEDEIISDLHAG